MLNKAIKKRIAAIDFGQVRIGLALSDVGQFLATPLQTIQAKPNFKETAAAILHEFTPHQPIEKIILGLPLMMNGKESPLSLKMRELKEILEEISGIPVILWDERLTTAQVERTLKEANMNRKKRAKHIDAMAAGLILQSYLDCPTASNCS